MDLVSGDYLNITNAFFSVFVVSMIIVIGGVVVMLVLFGISSKPDFQEKGKYLSLSLLALALPAMVLLFGRNTYLSSIKARSDLKILNLEIAQADENSYVVLFDTSREVSLSLVYKDYAVDFDVPVIADNNSNKTKKHSFLIRVQSEKGGEFYFMVDGQKYLLEGKPLRIPQEE